MNIKLVTRNYDQLTPLISGDVVADNIDLALDQSTSISAFLEDDSFQAGEMSFSKYLRQLAAGDTTIIGLPVFVMRGFRQRCFFVHRNSGLRAFSDLEGKRIGTNGWPDTGNIWSRALLRNAGVAIDNIDWLVGAIDGVTDEMFGHRFSTADLPANVSPAPDGQTLTEMLLSGDLDALMVPWPPRAFYDNDAVIIRLLPDYRRAEQEYARQVGFYPVHHIIGLRADTVKDHPWVVQSLYDALDESQRLAEEWRWAQADTTPWLLTDLEQITDILGADWQAHGITANHRVIQAFCEEIYVQGLIDQPLSPESVFASFQELVASS